MPRLVRRVFPLGRWSTVQSTPGAPGHPTEWPAPGRSNRPGQAALHPHPRSRTEPARPQPRAAAGQPRDDPPDGTGIPGEHPDRSPGCGTDRTRRHHEPDLADLRADPGWLRGIGPGLGRPPRPPRRTDRRGRQATPHRPRDADQPGQARHQPRRPNPAQPATTARRHPGNATHRGPPQPATNRSTPRTPAAPSKVMDPVVLSERVQTMEEASQRPQQRPGGTLGNHAPARSTPITPQLCELNRCG